MNSKGVFIGAYIPPRLKDKLKDRAEYHHRTLSQEITHILNVVIEQGLLLLKPGFLMCQRCGHQWEPRKQGALPKSCPQCKSPYWSKPRRSEAGGQKEGSTK
jgi:predicted Zn-ribbon and HTH transcriptional regulator